MNLMHEKLTKKSTIMYICNENNKQLEIDQEQIKENQSIHTHAKQISLKINSQIPHHKQINNN